MQLRDILKTAEKIGGYDKGLLSHPRYQGVFAATIDRFIVDKVSQNPSHYKGIEEKPLGLRGFDPEEKEAWKAKATIIWMKDADYQNACREWEAAYSESIRLPPIKAPKTLETEVLELNAVLQLMHREYMDLPNGREKKELRENW